jgi:multimeric flavodoxin WrbA
MGSTQTLRPIFRKSVRRKIYQRLPLISVIVPMKILALIGSPRRGSNTDMLVDKFLEGAESSGHHSEKLYLYDFEILPCIDCRKCKRESFTCALRDGMQQIYAKLEDADLIIFGTPIYWYGPTAKMKLLIDRLRPYIASGRLKGKKGMVIAPSEEGSVCCGPLMEMLRMSFYYLGMELTGSILATAYDRAEIAEKPQELERAYKMGASL